MKKILTLFISCVAFLSSNALASDTLKHNMVIVNQSAPQFMARDAEGKKVDLSDYKGQKVLLIFFRNVGCPICNLHMHELLENATYFKSKNLKVITIYESSAENIKKYTEGEDIPFTLIPNVDKKIYEQYAVGSSFWKGLGSFFFHGAASKAKKGDRLFKQKIKQDGNMNQLTADFLIDEQGKVIRAHYAKYLGDHISIEDLKKSLN